MIRRIQEMILDAQEQTFFTGIQRETVIYTVEKKASAIIGVRRCGKSTFLQQIIEELKNKGISSKNILYLNFFDDRLTALKSLGLDPVYEAYFTLFPEKKNREKIYCFFDEIQMVPQWELFIERMLRTEICEVYLSGSSARMLSKEIATQMRGRALSWELFPFSFREFVHCTHPGISVPLSTRDRLTAQNEFENFRQKGGFPEVYGAEPHIRVKIHQEYFNSLLFHDLIERYDIPHPRAVVDLSRKLTENVASLYTVNKLTNFLKTLGHKVPKSSVADYLAWFEDAYFLFTVRLYDASFARSNSNPKKIYCIDHAMVNSVTSGIMVNSGHLLENMVFMELRRFFTEIYYYRTAKNQEVDFMVIAPTREKLLFQVCESIKNEITRTRELAAIQQAMTEQQVSKSFLITLSEEKEVKLQEGTVTIIPAWRFFLEKSALTR
jgi:predicted AAA+ superfamily ATPase